ncbi:hypothetical protein H633G_03630 [Metarhizium anisopliae BRIP 53284]|nr:hypothetical protein H633G_03630 [Metarhizium anisopliae BRIP 53284]
MSDEVLMTGSIRVPALCCGTYGFRPTASRIPYSGQLGCADEGLAQILPCAGPLANDMKALSLFVKAVLQAKPASYDASALDVNWRDVQGQFGRKLRFGLLPEDSTYPLHPPVRRTVAEASRLLQASGHEVVELQSDECRISEALQVAFALFALDETADGIVKAAGEPPIPSRIRINQEMGKAPQELWQKYEIDAVIGPGGRTTAIEHDEFTLPPYTVLMNVLDCPACIIPFGRVTASDAAERLDLQPGQVVPSYNPLDLEGIPCCVQVFTSKMTDEKCLYISEVVDKCLQAKESFVVARDADA